MKRIAILAAALFGAALFFGCSNSSDTSSVPLSGSGSSGSGLPANVGTNELAGKTFVNTSGNVTTTYVFGDNSFSYTQITEIAASDDNDAFSNKTTWTVPYAYNSNTKQLFFKGISAEMYVIRNEVKMPALPLTYSTDAELVEGIKKVEKFKYNKANDETLTQKTNETVKDLRQAMHLSECGYADSNGEDAATPEQIAKYRTDSAARVALGLISIRAYNLSGTGAGATFKFEPHVPNDIRVPAGLGLNEIYGIYDISLTNVNGNLKKTISTKPDFYNGNTGLKVSSITTDKIVVSANASKANNQWTITSVPSATAISYTTTKTAAGATFAAESEFGTFTVTYATADNIPTLSSTTYTQQ